MRYEQLLVERFGRDTVPFGPSGHAVVPASIADNARYAWFGGTAVARDRTAESTVDDDLLLAAGLVGIQSTRPAGGDWSAWSRDVARLRIEMSEQLLEDCVRYLSDRYVDQTRLIDQQLVRADLADAATDLVELRALSAGPGCRPDLHRRLTAVDLNLLRLLGASGFLADGPGRRAAAVEWLSDAYGEAP
jgi:hypothetical protein